MTDTDTPLSEAELAQLKSWAEKATGGEALVLARYEFDRLLADVRRLRAALQQTGDMFNNFARRINPVQDLSEDDSQQFLAVCNQVNVHNKAALGMKAALAASPAPGDGAHVHVWGAPQTDGFTGLDYRKCDGCAELLWEGATP